MTKAPKYSWLKGIMLDSLHYLDSYGYINPPGALERNKEAMMESSTQKELRRKIIG